MLSLGDWRGGNLIGDKGATALADALMYVTITPPEFFLHFVYILFMIMGHYQGVFVSDLQPKQHVDGIVPQLQPNWRCWRCLDRWRLGVRHSFPFA